MCWSIINNNRGIALVVVVWILALLTTIAAELAFSMRTEVHIVRNFKEATQAHYIAQAGLNQAILILAHQNHHEPSELQGDATLSPTLRINAFNPPQPFADGQFLIRIDNAKGKVNINNAGPAMLGILLNGLNIDDREKAIIVDSILDWRDSDDLHRLNGAEEDFYQTLATPYTCKNGDFSDKAELRLVRGISPEIYKQVAPLIVALPSRSNVVYDEDLDDAGELGGHESPLIVKININAAPSRLLAGLPAMRIEDVDQIRQYRLNADFASYNDLAVVLGADRLAAIEPFITLALSPYYIIKVEGHMANSAARQTIEALVHFDAGLANGYQILRWKESLF